tara:strand:+ start:3169 stop:3414 length:246 start_codon:yes stop_codon:yes gene_type:complete
MAYKELKFTKPRIVKNQPKPPSKHIQTADLGTTIQFLSDNLNNIAHGAAAFNLGALGYTGHRMLKYFRGDHTASGRDAKPK